MTGCCSAYSVCGPGTQDWRECPPLSPRTSGRVVWYMPCTGHAGLLIILVGRVQHLLSFQHTGDLQGPLPCSVRSSSALAANSVIFFICAFSFRFGSTNNYHITFYKSTRKDLSDQQPENFIPRGGLRSGTNSCKIQRINSEK